MKHVFAGLLSFFSILAVSVHAQNGMHFEYKTTLSITPKGSAMHVYVLPSTGYRSETEMTFPNFPQPMKMVSIYQTQKPNVSIQINDAQKIYTEYTQQPTPATSSSAKTTVQVLGKETVSGYSCVHSKVTTGTVSYEIWTTKDITGYDELTKHLHSQQNSDLQHTWAQLKANHADGFMVKMASSGKTGMTVELVKAEKKTLAASLFAPPAGYKKLEKNAYLQQQMQAMMKKRN
jgi:hypothetical protein